MSEDFDPYHQWLGIPASEQPPHHYRLLAIPAFEGSPSVIENASDQRMAHLRTFQTGKHSALSQKLLNEVATAKVCLLNPQKKAAYDQRLRQDLPPSGQADGSETSSLDPQLAAVFETGITRTSGITSKGRGKKSQSKPAVFIAVAAVAVVALAAAWWAVERGSTPSDDGIAKADPVPSAKGATDVSPQASEPSRKPTPVAASPVPKKESPKAKVVSEQREKAEEETKPSPEEEKTEAKPESKDTAAKKPEPDDEKAPTKKIAPPSADEQKRLMGEVDEVYKPGEAKNQEAKVALARKLLEDGRKNEANRAEQFVLLRRAGEVARDAGDTAAMLEAVDAMVAAGFDIRPLQVKARLLKQLVSVPGGATQVSAVITACVKFAEETAAGGAPDEALDVLGAAKKTLADSTKRAQNANRVARAALARARSSADKAAQEKKADEAQAELEAIKSAQTALADCAKGLQQVRHEHEVILAAQEKLKTDPDDADACLAVGRWYCFYEGDWDEGLKLLAKGSDDALKSLAAEELASKPAKAEDKVARGDAWWDLGEKATGKTKAAMRRRAGQWYQEALPELASGLGKSRVEKRLAQAADEPAPETVSRPAHILPPLAVAPFNERTALLHQKRWAKYLGVPVVQANSIGMKLALIPPGEFDMGSPKELIGTEARLHANDGWYRDRLPGEGPQHRIQITRPFFVGVTCVTQGEYERVMGTNPSKFQGDPKRPVEQVSWNEAVEFCRKVSELPGEKEAKRRYGLPTEAQWEYACRAGSQSRWSFGDDPAKLGEYGWFNGNSGGMSHPVGQKQPNVWGLYDMYGNVWEWCGDGYEKGYYENSPKDDPAGSSGGSQRAFRGGSWIIAAWACRSAFRDGRGPAERDNNLGFRVSVSLADDAGGKSPTATALAPVEHHAQVEAAPEASGRPARVHPPLAVAPCNEKTAILHQKRWAKYLGAPVVQANSIGMKLALIPPGEFQMGSPKELIEEEWRLHGGYGWYKDHLLGEGPQHRVRITKPFWLGVTEVTQEEYERVMSSSPSKFQGNGKRPVEQVSWNDAIEFCRKLSELSGEKMAKRRYDLPTEAQWEHACRAGNMGRFSFSSARGEILKETEEKELAEYGWFGENAGGLTHAVGSKRASVWGLYDMHGNVWEWCRDYYDKGYYAESPTDDPVGPSGGLNRVSRGGSWVFPACACRSALRHYDVPGGRVDSVGFRVSVSLADDAGGKSPTATALAPVKHHAQVEAVPEVERAAW